MKVIAYKSRWSPTVFTDRAKYIKHLKTVREENRVKHRVRKSVNNFMEWFSVEKEKLNSPEEIFQWVIENQTRLMHAYNSTLDNSNIIDKFHPTDRILYLHPRMKFAHSPNTSNTHCAPRGYKTNWSRNKEIPTGYPGCSGYLDISLDRDKKTNGVTRWQIS